MKPAFAAVALALLVSWSIALPAAATVDAGIEPGSPGVVRTVVDERGPVEVPVRFIGTLENFAGPGRDVHLVELEGPVGETVGVASGMSGSPVYFDGKLLGALAYRYGLLPKRAIGGVTPIEDVVAAGGGAAASTPASAPGLTPISTPIAIPGLVEPVRRWLEPQLESVGLVAVSGGGTASGASTDEEPFAGMPIAVLLVGGDLTFAATGTVTRIDGDTLYAFGHPFLGIGRAEIPMARAEVVHTTADMAGSFRMANIGAEIGAVTGDRLTAIVGRLDRRARVIPVSLTLRGGGYGLRKLRFTLSPHRTLAPQLAAAAVANAMLRDVGFDDAMTVVGGGRITLEGLPDVPLSMAFSGNGASAPALAVAGELRAVLAALFDNPFAAPPITSIELGFDLALDRHEFRIEEVLYDRGPVAPGQVLRFECVLRGYRDEVVRRSMEVRVPDSLASGTRLALAVGGEGWIRGASRTGIAQRVSSARDLPSLVRALGDPGRNHRLTAVLYRPGRGVSAGGAVLQGLPGTANRLLSTSESAGAIAAAKLAPLARAEVELTGPVDGGVVVRLDVGRGGWGDE